MTTTDTTTEQTDAQKFLTFTSEADKELKEKEEAYHRASNEMDAARRAARNARREAWDILRNSDDELIKWIGQHCESYSDHAKIVLAALPATYDQLQALAQEQEWCGDWDSFLSRAVRAGVIEKPKLSPAAQAYADWHRRHYGEGRDAEQMLFKLLAGLKAEAEPDTK